jgi:xanthine dehydrogenase accessory factor
VCFSSAVHEKYITVEGVTACLADDIASAERMMLGREIPVLIDPDLVISTQMKPAVIVDARMRKCMESGDLNPSAFLIGLGPGFDAGKNCRSVIETNRGSRLGRVILDGSSEPDTGIPESVYQYSADRVLRAPANGVLKTRVEIAESVLSEEVIAVVDGVPIQAKFNGVVRGLLRDGSIVREGVKIGDLDPRNDPALASMISDKALAVGGGVLEAILSDQVIRDKLMGGQNETA